MPFTMPKGRGRKAPPFLRFSDIMSRPVPRGGAARRHFAKAKWATKEASGLPRAAPVGDAGWSSPVARQAHNLKVVGSNPTPATTISLKIKDLPLRGKLVVVTHGRYSHH
jgi:hypothetical protein